MEDKTHNYALDFYKLIGIFFISIYHARIFNCFSRGYIWVEFFFVCSGYFLYNSYEKNKDKSVIQYIKNRFIRLYPEYIAAWIVLFFSNLFVKGFPYKNFYQLVCELFMIQSVGIKGIVSINYPCWYISVMFFSSIIVIFALKTIKAEFRQFILCLLSIFIGYLIIYIDNANIEQWGYKFYFFFVPMLRGIGGLCIGIVINFLSKKIKWKESVFFNLIELVIFLTIFFSMFTNVVNDFYILILFCFLFFFATSNFSLFSKVNKKFLNSMMKYEYSIFLNHAFVIMLCKFIGLQKLNQFVYFVIFILILFVYSIVFHKLVLFLLNMIKNNRG